jgi:hypothetical protein
MRFQGNGKTAEHLGAVFSSLLGNGEVAAISSPVPHLSPDPPRGTALRIVQHAV